jgi:hypothetical protein
VGPDQIVSARLLPTVENADAVVAPVEDAEEEPVAS